MSSEADDVSWEPYDWSGVLSRDPLLAERRQRAEEALRPVLAAPRVRARLRALVVVDSNDHRIAEVFRVGPTLIYRAWMRERRVRFEDEHRLQPGAPLPRVPQPHLDEGQVLVAQRRFETLYVDELAERSSLWIEPHEVPAYCRRCRREQCLVRLTWLLSVFPTAGCRRVVAPRP